MAPERALGRAGAAAGAGGLGDPGRGLGLRVHGDGLVGADLGADAAGGAQRLRSTSAVIASTRSVPRVHQAHGPGGGGRGLGDGLLDVLGPFGAAGEEDAPGGRIHRLELGMGLQEEAVGGLLQGQHLLDDLHVLRRLHAHGQDDHLGPVRLELVGGRVLHRQDEVLGLGVLLDRPGQPADVADAHALAAAEEVLEALAEGPDVDVEDLDLDVRVVLLEHQGALDRVHAADVGAVGLAPPLGARADALDEGDRLGASSGRSGG